MGECMSKIRKTRTTLVLEEAVVKKLKQESQGNISELANRILKKALFGWKGKHVWQVERSSVFKGHR